MLVQCIANTGIAIPEKYRNWEVDETIYSTLKINETYHVYGMAFSPKRVDFLVCSKDGNLDIGWVPQILFNTLEHTIPSDWSIRLPKEDPLYDEIFEQAGTHAFIGYERLINSREHFLGILEREEKELIYFLQNVLKSNF